ncbi:hypothetical protein LSS_18598 [Leptospira santarosai serovar Shermani str. LT 821]|uniref:Uncharacterized protein n=1 Tax=Leptospira santarosai serovar Shermani str. LT 821 TaxID=758847 RepID=K8XWI2_9LEPT|nr:hypothetical protein LSS_18598 [Leptospira santarosai serovar Shermani str. LT 821]EPG82647.1 hypothetical protein LEP1GSC048_0370 [Leptospira santarosai serovar Shermani str. 1342KT]
MESIPNRNFDSNALPIGPRIRTYVRRKYDDFPQNLRPTLVLGWEPQPHCSLRVKRGEAAGRNRETPLYHNFILFASKKLVFCRNTRRKLRPLIVPISTTIFKKHIEYSQTESDCSLIRFV